MLLRNNQEETLTKALDYLNSLFTYFNATPFELIHDDSNFLHFRNKYNLQLNSVDIFHELLTHKNHNVQNKSIVLIATLCHYTPTQSQIVVKSELFETMFVLMRDRKISNKLMLVTAINSVIETKIENDITYLINYGVIDILCLVLEDDVSLSCIYKTLTAMHNLLEFGKKIKILNQLCVLVLVNKSDRIIRNYLTISEVRQQADNVLKYFK